MLYMRINQLGANFNFDDRWSDKWITKRELLLKESMNIIWKYQ